MNLDRDFPLLGPAAPGRLSEISAPVDFHAHQVVIPGRHAGNAHSPAPDRHQAQYLLTGEYTNEEIVLSLDALADFEAKSDALVTLEAVEPGTVQARWDDSGVPQVKSYTSEDPAKLADYPSLPEKMATVEPGIMQALAEATQSSGADAIRYAVNHIQLKGKANSIVATNGRQLLLQRGFSFPWTDDVLVPASPVYACRELSQDAVALGKTDSHVTIQAGPWMLHLPIDKDGRFPAVDKVIPKREAAIAQCCLAMEDCEFLVKSLSRLPGGEDEYAPVTLDLNGSVCVRARADGQEQTVELMLSRSQATGKAVRLTMDRTYLARAARLGLEDVYIQDAAKPVLFQDEKRQFVVVPLTGNGSLPPCQQAICISSLQTTSNADSKPHRRIKTVSDSKLTNTDVTPADTNGNIPDAPSSQAPPIVNKPRARKQKNTGMPALINEAESLRNSLRDLASRAHNLVIALKRQRKQSKLMATTLASLRQLQHIDG